MAKEIGDGGSLWLPSDFLCDDDFFEEARIRRAEATFVLDQQLGQNADYPAEAEACVEDCLASLTRRMAHTSVVATEKAKKRATACACLASTKGSLNGTYLVSSPPLFLLEHHRSKPWDLFCEAAAQVMRLRHSDARYLQKLYDRGLLHLPKKPSVDVSKVTNNSELGYQYTSPALTPQQHLQDAQFRFLKQQQLLKQQLSASCEGGQGKARGSPPQGLCPSAWPASPREQQQPAQLWHGARAVFLNSTGAKRASAGTGVFLPRIPLSKPEMRKSPDCSTVLVPARVVQALNLGMEELGAQPRFADDFLRDHNARGGRTNALLSHQMLNHQVIKPTSIAAAAGEIQLPPEWTY